MTGKDITLRFTEVEIPLLVTPVIKIGFGIYYANAISLSDFSYGDFIIYQNNLPKFYFSVFESNNDAIANDAEKHNKPVPNHLLDLLRNSGFEHVHSEEKGFELFRLDKKKRLETFKLLAISAEQLYQ